MFTYYQNLNARREENELQREAESTGHDRFCQSRPGVTTRRKRRNQLTSRRTQSAIEIEQCNNDAFASVRSVLLQRKEKSASIEEDELTPASNAPATPAAVDDLENKAYYQLSRKIDSLAKILFNRVYAVKAGYNKDQNDAQRYIPNTPIYYIYIIQINLRLLLLYIQRPAHCSSVISGISAI